VVNSEQDRGLFLLEHSQIVKSEASRKMGQWTVDGEETLNKSEKVTLEFDQNEEDDKTHPGGEVRAHAQAPRHHTQGAGCKAGPQEGERMKLGTWAGTWQCAAAKPWLCHRITAVILCWCLSFLSSWMGRATVLAWELWESHELVHIHAQNMLRPRSVC
jgi:hypothetical protein